MRIIINLFLHIAFIGFVILYSCKNSSDYHNSGNAKFNMKDYNGAIEDYNKAIELNPNSSISYLGRAKVKYEIKNYKEAFDDADKSIKLDPSNLDSYLTRGSARFLLGDWLSAYEDYNKVIEADQDNIFAYILRGIVQDHLGDYKNSIKDYLRARELALIEGRKDLLEKCDDYLKNKNYSVNNSNSQVKDKDGNVFKTATIGTQEWTSENLNVEYYRNGDVIPQIKDKEEWSKLRTGAWCYYENNSENKKTYGKLYNWYAVNDPRGLAPKGWHIPSNEEWTQLTDYLGGYAVAGGKLKAATLWESPNTGAKNSSGFTAFPGGRRRFKKDFDFSGIATSGYFWSSTEINDDEAWVHTLYFASSDVERLENYKKNGLSVRCVRD